MHFSIVKINPEDAQPSHGFDDAIFPLYYALAALGFEVEILFNRVNPHSRNIVFGSVIAPRRVNRLLPPGSIVFNLEQLGVAESKWCNEHYLAHLRSFTVWDYSAANTAALRAAGVDDAVHLPLGYVPEMTRLKADFPAEADALFYGLVTERRHRLIQAFLAAGVHTLVSQEAFGNLRDKLLARSRLVLNIHQFLPARLEVVRLGYVWANKKPVLSEKRDDTFIPEHLAEACLYADYDDMPEAARTLLAAPKRLKRLGETGFKAFKARPLSADLEKIVGRRTRAFAPPPGTVQDEAYYLKPAREWLITG